MEIVKRTDYWVVAEDEDGESYMVFFESRDEMLIWCSKQIAFADCGGYWIPAVCENMRVWKYMGWQPNMVFEWRRQDGEVWVRQFEEWDH